MVINKSFFFFVVGLHTVGAPYPSNSGVGFCSEAGKVCHEDDIKIVVCFASSHSLHKLFN
jgi:hypothetical protein